MLGIFDSGLGGLTVLRQIRAQLPGEDILYFADQAHVPYGDKSPKELRDYLAQAVSYLESQGVEAIVMGCNTSCAIAAEFGYPPSRVPILDLIEAAARAVAAQAVSRVGVLATVATVRSGAYGNAIRALAPQVSVQEIPAPALVPLVEAGYRKGALVRAAVARACGNFTEQLGALVLACTHYPLLDEVFADVLGEQVMRIDPALAQAERTVAFLRERGAEALGSGRTRYVTSGEVEAFRANLAMIVGDSMEVAQAEKLPLGVSI